jgi:anti-anti-sigma factor
MQDIDTQIHSRTTCIVRLRGEHDVSSSDALSATLVAAGAYEHVLVDLAECTFIDSTLISSLLAASKSARERGRSVELVVPAEANAVRRTLELANVQMVLPFHASRATALESMAAADRVKEHGPEPEGEAPTSTILRAQVTDETRTSDTPTS